MIYTDTPSAYGMVVVKENYQRVGNSTLRTIESVEWQGPPITRLSLDLLDGCEYDSLDVGEYILMGPLLLRIVEREPMNNCVVVCNVESWASSLYELRFWFTGVWRPISWRIVYTLAIWGLAHYPEPGTYIGWYLVKERWL